MQYHKARNRILHRTPSVSRHHIPTTPHKPSLAHFNHTSLTLPHPTTSSHSRSFTTSSSLNPSPTLQAYTTFTKAPKPPSSELTSSFDTIPARKTIRYVLSSHEIEAMVKKAVEDADALRKTPKTTRKAKSTLEVNDDKTPISSEKVTEKMKKAAKANVVNESLPPLDFDGNFTQDKPKKPVRQSKATALADKDKDTPAPLLTNLGNPIKRSYSKSEDHNDRIFKEQQEIPVSTLSSSDSLTMVSWNLAGFRGSIKNGFWKKFEEYPRIPDIVCLQEMKIQLKDLEKLPSNDYSDQLKKNGYAAALNLGEKAGYSGVGIFYNEKKLKLHKFAIDSSFAYPPPTKARTNPTGGLTKFFGAPKTGEIITKDSISNGPELTQDKIDLIAAKTGDTVSPEMRADVWDVISTEGRIITADFGAFFLITTYVPNSGQDLERLPYRHRIYEPVVLEYLMLLQLQKPVIYCGDLNAASDTIDVHMPSSCVKSAGFQAEEVERINLLSHTSTTGFVDAFRQQQGADVHGYTYWGHRFNGRANNRGWRIDYFMISQELFANGVTNGTMVTDEFKPSDVGSGRISDHAPLWISFDFTHHIFQDAKH